MTGRRIVLVGWIVFLLYAYPGYMTHEAADTLADVHARYVNDLHAPMMTRVWGWMHRLISGPAGMLVLQSGLFVAGAYAVLKRGLSERRAAIATAAIVCFPPVAAPLAAIWRDAQLAGFLLAGGAAILSDRRPVRVGGLALLLLGATMREGAAIAALPLLLAWFRWSDALGAWPRRGIAVAAWLAIALLAHGLDGWVAKGHTGRRELLRAQLDVVGTIRYATDTSDDALRAELERAGLWVSGNRELRRHARALYRYPGRHGDIIVLPEPTDARARAALLNARVDFALAHPGAFARHRFAQLRMLLGFGRVVGWRRVYTQFVEDPARREVLRHRATHSTVQKGLIRVVRGWPAFSFKPYLYALLALALLPLAIVRRDRIAGPLLASGLLYELWLGLSIVGPEYRHSLWMIACTIVASAMLGAQELRRRRAAAPPSSS